MKKPRMSWAVMAATLIMVMQPAGPLMAESGAPDEHEVLSALLDRLKAIEQRLTAIENGLFIVRDDEGEVVAGNSGVMADTARATSSPVRTTVLEDLVPGALVIFRPKPADLDDISSDRLGGIVHDGRPINLDDLPALGVPYHDVPAVELAGLVPVDIAGRYQLTASVGIDRDRLGHVDCALRVWVDGENIAVVTGKTLKASGNETVAITAGFTLEPGLRPFQAWFGCHMDNNGFRLQQLGWFWLEPEALNTRPLKTDDLFHQAG